MPTASVARAGGERVAPASAPGRSSPAARVALITGASRGLGSTLAKFLAKQDWTLVVTARNEGELRDSAASLGADDGSVHVLAGDVADPRHRGEIADAVRRIGRLDLLVNNASELGASPLPPLAAYPLGTLRHVLEVNVVAPIALVQDLLPLLKASHGLVVNITSDAAHGGYPGWGAYGASKAALELASKTLAEELRPSGVAVVAVDPGNLRTKMHQDAYPGEDIGDRPLPDVTIPFWAWLLGQDPRAVTGRTFEAQGALWEVPA